jgi:hypothetical protein
MAKIFSKQFMFVMDFAALQSWCFELDISLTQLIIGIDNYHGFGLSFAGPCTRVKS